MSSVQFYSVFALFLFCYFDGGNEVSASKGKCKDACDKRVNLREVNMDNYEDDGIGARDELEEDLKLHIKVLEKETKSLLRKKDKLKKALTECLDRDIAYRKSSGILEFDLCEIFPDGCGERSSRIIDDPNDDGPNDDSHLETEGSKIEYYNRLRERIRDLEATKDKYEKDIKWLQDRLDECKERTKTSKTNPTTTPKSTTTTPKQTTTTTPKPTTTTKPKPKQKKYIIRTNKVSWYEAVRLCTNEQKQIATITSGSDQAALGQARKDQGVPSGQIWVGGRRNSPSDQFFWKEPKPTAFTYTNWHSTEPSHWSDEDQNCVESSWESNQYMWFVYECGTKYNYACEYY